MAATLKPSETIRLTKESMLFLFIYLCICHKTEGLLFAVSSGAFIAQSPLYVSPPFFWLFSGVFVVQSLFQFHILLFGLAGTIGISTREELKFWVLYIVLNLFAEELVCSPPHCFPKYRAAIKKKPTYTKC